MTAPPATHDGQRTAVGYALLLSATVLFALNGSVVKSILLSGVSATTLSETRAMGAFAILFIIVARIICFTIIVIIILVRITTTIFFLPYISSPFGIYYKSIF